MNRGESQQPFESPEEALKHSGVKGMKWGVRKDQESGDDRTSDPKDAADHNAQTKMYMAEAKKMPDLSPKEAAANLVKNQEKFAAKFTPPSDASTKPVVKAPGGKIEGHKKKEPKLTPEQKKAMIAVGGSVAVVAGVYIGARYLNNNPDVMMKGMAKLLKVDPSALTPTDPSQFGLSSFSELPKLAGKPIDPKNFNSLIGVSQSKTWGFGGTGYLTDSAFNRPAFEIPAGHTFFRLSTQAEKSFGANAPTYCTAVADDFNRYVAGFRFEKGLDSNFHKVTWKSTAPVKVPDLTTTLGELHSVLQQEATTKGNTHKFTPVDVMKEYNVLSGGGWQGSRGKSLIGRLKSKGYGAIVDEMDAGVIGEKPLVFFDVNHATPKKNLPLSSEDIRKAEELLKEIPHPPGRKF